MGHRRGVASQPSISWLVAGAALWASYAVAGPEGQGSGSGSGDIEMEPEAMGSGSAQPPDAGSAAGSDAVPVKDPKVAKKWLQAAQVLVQKGDYWTRAQKPADAKTQYENAVIAYQKAIESSDDISLYYALALVEDKLAQDAEAFRHLKLVVDPKANAKPDLVKKAQTKLDEVSGKVGIVTLTIKPDGATIMLAGKQVGESPMTEPLVFDPGTYTLSLTAVGFQPKDAEIKVEAGSESERKIEMEPVPIVVKKTDEPEPEQPKPTAPNMLPLYIGAGATGGFFLIGTITGIAAISAHSTYTDPKTLQIDRKDAQANGRTLAHVTDLMFVGAIGAAAFTTYWYLYQYKPQEQAKVSVAPWVQSSASGVTVVGAF